MSLFDAVHGALNDLEDLFNEKSLLAQQIEDEVTKLNDAIKANPILAELEDVAAAALKTIQVHNGTLVTEDVPVAPEPPQEPAATVQAPESPADPLQVPTTP